MSSREHAFAALFLAFAQDGVRRTGGGVQLEKERRKLWRLINSCGGRIKDPLFLSLGERPNAKTVLSD